MLLTDISNWLTNSELNLRPISCPKSDKCLKKNIAKTDGGPQIAKHPTCDCGCKSLKNAYFIRWNKPDGWTTTNMLTRHSRIMQARSYFSLCLSSSCSGVQNNYCTVYNLCDDVPLKQRAGSLMFYAYSSFDSGRTLYDNWQSNYQVADITLECSVTERLNRFPDVVRLECISWFISAPLWLWSLAGLERQIELKHGW